MVDVRFKVGDIIHITKYNDPNAEIYDKQGIVLISDYTGPYVNSTKGIYILETLRGNLTFINYGAQFFDKLPYLVYIGNIYDNPTLKVLYGQIHKKD